MTWEQAMKLLDRLKEGIDYPQSAILMALKITGDLDE